MHEPVHPHHRPVIGTPLFQVDGLRHHYTDGIEAVTGIDLAIAAGDRLALVGQNGSGKTTLVKLLCGLLVPTAGAVRYQGEVLSGGHLARCRLNIGLLFQDPDDQLFGHTLIDDIAFGPRNQGSDRDAAQAAANRALSAVSLSEMAYKAPHDLSVGQKKRAALAGLLAMRPEVLILDEPTANLDPRQEQVFLDLLKDFDGTLICISHDLIFLYELCERAVVLDRGHVHHDFTMRELVTERRALREHGLDFSFRLVTDPEITGDLPPTHHHRHHPHFRTGALSDDSVDSPMVALRDYDYRYPDGTLALHGVNWAIGRGERVAIVGENGAGKTTLLSCLLGLRHGHGGFDFDGRPVTRRGRRRLWRRVGMVFQDSADQLFCPSVWEEVAFGLEQMGRPKVEIEARVAEALARVHLDGFNRRVPLNLSGGERKRLSLACVLAMRPELMILDEPTAGLDPQGEELLLAILRDLDTTLLLVSHDMHFVRELTDRTIVLHQGHIIEDIITDDFVRNERLGNLNGLAFTFRQESSDAIRRLQHEHEHNHPHQHLHDHAHRHGALAHSHPHEHTHAHPHTFVHSHDGADAPHDHAQHRYHDHDHPAHDEEDHDHSHQDR